MEFLFNYYEDRKISEFEIIVVRSRLVVYIL